MTMIVTHDENNFPGKETLEWKRADVYTSI